MSNVIYVDVLIIVNIFINFFLLLATSKFTSKSPKRLRILAGATFGSLLSLLILIDLNQLLMQLIKVAGLALTVFITFGYKRFSLFIKTLLIFLAVNFVFAGVITAVWFLITPAGMIYKNGVVYFNISSYVLFAVTILSYLVMSMIEYILKRRVVKQQIYKIKIQINENSVELEALYDTGNNIIDTISGHPVTVCEIDSIENLLTYEDKINISEFICKGNFINSNSLMKKKFRLVPYHVINSSGIMICIVPDNIWVSINNVYKKINCEVGITCCRLSQGEYQAILNSKCLSKI